MFQQQFPNFLVFEILSFKNLWKSVLHHNCSSRNSIVFRYIGLSVTVRITFENTEQTKRLRQKRGHAQLAQNSESGKEKIPSKSYGMHISINLSTCNKNTNSMCECEALSVAAFLRGMRASSSNRKGHPRSLYKVN